MTKERLVRMMIDHMNRGEDALWLAERYQMSTIADKELHDICRTLRIQSDLLYARLSQLNDDLELNIDLSLGC